MPRQALGATLKRGILPTAKEMDFVNLGQKNVGITICDVGNITVFARAVELGISGAESSRNLNADKDLLGRVKEIRGKAAQLVGMCNNWVDVDRESPMLPLVVLVSEVVTSGAHLQSRLFLDNACHTAMAATGAICTAACSQISGSIVSKIIANPDFLDRTLKIEHPMGVIPIVVERDNDNSAGSSISNVHFKTLSSIRTSRRILDGKVYIPSDV